MLLVYLNAPVLLFLANVLDARKLVPPIACIALKRLPALQTELIPTTTSITTSTTTSRSSSSTSSAKPTVTVFPLCEKLVVTPAYDPKGNAYGTENGKSCVSIHILAFLRFID
jgi:hypothetical protein